MKKSIYNKFKFALLLLSLISVCGCEGEVATIEPEVLGEDNAAIMIATRAGSIDPGDALRTLRLFVFALQKDGSYKPVLNKLFETSTATSATSVPSNFVSYFIKDTTTGEYKISEILKKSTIKVMMVANELTNMAGVDNIDDVQKAVLDVYSVYGGSGALDIDIDNSGGGNSNKGYIPMYAETPPITPYEWNGMRGKVIELNLVRVFAKVTFKIADLNVTGDPLASAGTISINSASIVRVPRSEWLGASSAYAGTFVSTAIKNFQKVVTSGNPGVTESDELEFYIPEYILSEENKQNGMYSYLQLNALHKENATGKETVSTYRILLGDGMDEFYATGSGIKDDAAIASLSKEELSISRNKNYNYEAKIASTGALAVMKVSVKIEDWTEKEVDGSIDAPSLSLSSVRWEYDASGSAINRIYFWTNVSGQNLKFEPTVTVDGASTAIAIGDVFDNLSLTTFTSADLVFPYNGYFNLAVKSPHSSFKTIVLTLNAGGLKRTITVVAPSPIP